MNFSKASNQSRLTGSDVLDIRRLHDINDFNDAQLSRLYGVCRKSIYNIVNRKSWRQVPNPVSIKGFRNYTIFPDGRVFSNTTETFMTEITRNSGPAVRITTTRGMRETVSVSSLLRRGFGRRL